MGQVKVPLQMYLLGHPKYSVTSGEIIVKGKSILELPTDEELNKEYF